MVFLWDQSQCCSLNAGLIIKPYFHTEKQFIQPSAKVFVAFCKMLDFPSLWSVGLVLRGAAKLLIRRDVDPPHVQLGSKRSGLLVEEERELPVGQEVVVDGGQAGAQLQLGPLVAQIHGCSQGQVIVACSVMRVLWREQQCVGW